MIEMTLSSRHRVQTSSHDGLRPSTLPLYHGGSPQYISERGRNICVSLKRAGQVGFRDFRLSKLAALTTAPKPPPCRIWWPTSQHPKKQDVEPMLGQCWITVCNADPALTQHWVNVSPLLVQSGISDEPWTRIPDSDWTRLQGALWLIN